MSKKTRIKFTKEQNVQYWKDRMLFKLTSFRKNYDFEVFDTIIKNSKHIGLKFGPILKQIEKIKKESTKLAELITNAEVDPSFEED